MSDVMWSVAQIAARDGVSKAAVSKAIKKLLEAHPETPVVRDGQGRIASISLAHYDEYRARFVNPAKASAPIREVSSDSPPSLPRLDPSDSFDEARRQSEWLKVGREKIRHQQECGQLVRLDMVEEAHKKLGAEIQSVIRGLPNHADEVALAISKEGVHGVRQVLRTIAFAMGNKIADKMAAIAEAAPESDPLIESEDI
ncbi:hypothetical protein BJF92_12130 [Rhizobium rhizosphaerae]|uniref:Uncharacterized protein n=1 Tax=Xaviernesmea rhizosphaerae TaxID=1672749 RepID=A0A1Q9AN36_9HYPH|nr:hypothetical protein [Xaviernesmea rhizosphaerae]OLP56812.1 hypothetical protein BJF92_12130 [Xaviernesmea rhizosphaerae]